MYAFDGVRSAKLVEEGVVDITTSETAANKIFALYDVFVYDGNFIVTGQQADELNQTAVFGCPFAGLDLDKRVLVCLEKHKRLNFTLGSVQIQNNNLYVHDLYDGTLTWYLLKRGVPFQNINWGTQRIEKVEVRIPMADYRVRRIVGSDFGVIINWITAPWDEDVGSTVITFSSKNVDFFPNQTMTEYGKSIVVVAGNKGDRWITALRRHSRAYFVIPYSQAQPVKTQVTFTVTDDDGSVSVTTYVEQLPNLKSKVEIKNTIGSLKINHDSFQYINFKAEDILQGNGLNKVNFSTTTQNINYRIFTTSGI